MCPVEGPDGISVVIVDATDDLPEVAKRQALQILDDLITGLPAYYKLDIRVLDIPNMRSRSLFAKCNPGDGSGLSEWTIMSVLSCWPRDHEMTTDPGQSITIFDHLQIA